MAEKTKRSAAGRIVLLLLVGGVVIWFVAARNGKSLASAVAGPTVLTNESSMLSEGQWKSYEYVLPADRKLEIHVSASPKPVHVLTMDEASYKEFQAANKKILGGRYHYNSAMSSEQVTNFNSSGILPKGPWWVVVFFPQHSLIFADNTKVNVRVLGY